MNHTTVCRVAYSNWVTAFLPLLLLVGLAGKSRAQAPTWQGAVALTNSSNTNCHVSSVATDGEGNVYVAGGFAGGLTLSGIVLTSIGDYDAFVAKWSRATNQFVWAQRIAGASYDEAYGVAVSGTSVYVVGQYQSSQLYVGGSATPLPKVGLTNGFIVKLTDAGASAGYTWGQRLGNEAVANAVAASGNKVYVTATFGNSLTIAGQTLTAAGKTDAAVVKLLDAGSTSSFQWGQRAGGTETDDVSALAVSGSAIYIGGWFEGVTADFGTTVLTNTNSNYGVYDGYVAKIVDAGSTSSFQWTQQISGRGGERVTALAVSGNRVYAGGSFSGWPTATFGSTTLTNQGDWDGFVAQLTDAGATASFSWAKRLGSTSADEVHGLAASGASVYAVGLSNSSAPTFGSQSPPVAVTGSGSGFVARLTDSGTDGSFTWVLRAGGGSSDAFQAIALSNGRATIAGNFYSYSAVFGGVTINGTGTENSYLAWLGDATLATGPATGAGTLQVYPNPARTSVTVQLPVIAAGATARLLVCSALGQVVRTYPLTATGATACEVNLAGLAPGAYVLRVQAGKTTLTQRLLVE